MEGIKKIRNWCRRKKGCFGLFLFVKKINSLIIFLTTLEQQKELIFYFIRLTLLFEEASDKGCLNTFDLRKNILSGTNTNEFFQKVLEDLKILEKISKNNPFYEKFLDNFIKTWETHKIRDFNQKNKVKISFNQGLKSAEERGSSYFLSFIYLLNPSNLSKKLVEVIKISGYWFQLIDDYCDRKKDKRKKNTIFTIFSEKPSRLFRKYKLEYKKQLEFLLKNSQHSLIHFFELFSFLWPIFDWHF